MSGGGGDVFSLTTSRVNPQAPSHTGGVSERGAGGAPSVAVAHDDGLRRHVLGLVVAR